MRRSILIVVTFGFFYLLYTPNVANSAVACVTCEQQPYGIAGDLEISVCKLDSNSRYAKCKKVDQFGCDGATGVCNNPFGSINQECRTCYTCPPSCSGCVCPTFVIITPTGAERSCSQDIFINSVE